MSNRLLLLGALMATVSWAAPPDNPTQPLPGPIPPTSSPPTGFWRWFDPATAPFIPVPEIGIDPNGGTTLGLIPTWVRTDQNHEINRIIAPDVLYTPYFGFGAHGRVYGYSSGDEQWSLITGIKQRVERELNAEYQRGRLREGRWSYNASLIYDRSGVSRFYGIGNDTPKSAETNFTNQQERAQVQVGLNLAHAWQLLYTARLQVTDVLPGTLNKIASIETRFSSGILGTNRLILNRLSINYDTRDDLTVPSRGMQLVAYAGVAGRTGLLNDSMYSELGGDGRAFWPAARNTIIAAHLALRYLPTLHSVPFWALSSVGGGDSVVGGYQPLRGYGTGRFYDRDSLSSSLEVRRKVWTVSASTSIDVEVTPFIDVGRVFARSGTFPLSQLHHVYGVGVRGVARPFVVGYVDIGYGSEGVAAFTGLNYPF